MYAFIELAVVRKGSVREFQEGHQKCNRQLWEHLVLFILCEMKLQKMHSPRKRCFISSQGFIDFESHFGWKLWKNFILEPEFDRALSVRCEILLDPRISFGCGFFALRRFR